MSDKKRLNCWFPGAERSHDGSGAAITHEDDGSLTITVRDQHEKHGYVTTVLASVRLGPKAVNLLTYALENGWDGTEPEQETVAPILDEDLEA